MNVCHTDSGRPWFARRFAAVAALFLLAAFPKLALGWESLFYRDYGVLGYPCIFHHAQAFWRGEIPLWNPLSNCGAPFLAQWGTMTLYPGALIYLWLPLPWSLSLFCLAHLFLAALGMFFLARHWTACGFAASVAGIAYLFSGVTLSCMTWPNYTVALGWMPWVVLWAERAWRQGGGAVFSAAIMAAFQVLSGVPEIILMTWLVVLGLCVTEAGGSLPPGRLSGLSRMGDTRGTVPTRTVALRLGGIILLTTGLTLAQMLPFFELLAHAQRDTAFATGKWAMPGWGWANLVVPLFHYFETPQGTFFQSGQTFFSSYYLGLAPLILALWGVWRSRQPRVWWLAGLGLFSLIMALGDNGYLYSWLRRLFPALGFARFTVKFTVLLAFVVPVLAAFGMRWWITGTAEAARPTTATTAPKATGPAFPAAPPPACWRPLAAAWLVLLTVMGWLLWFAWRHPFPYDQWDVTAKNAALRFLFLTLICAVLFLLKRAPAHAKPAQLGLLGLLALDLGSQLPRQNPSIAVSHFSPGWWETANRAPRPRWGEARVFITPAAEAALLNSAVPDWSHNFTGRRLALWSNLNLLEAIPKINGSSTLQLREQKQVENLIYQGPGTNCSGLLEFLGAAWITAPGRVIEWTNRSPALPLATVGPEPVFADAAQTLRRLAATDFNPRQTAFLPLELKPVVAAPPHPLTNPVAVPPAGLSSGQPSLAQKEPRACIRSARYATHSLELEVEASTASLLVLAQSYYPPWRAYVDETPKPLWRANHAFQALEVPAGRHRARIVYYDRAFYWGALVSGLVLLSCLAAWMRYQRRS